MNKMDGTRVCIVFEYVIRSYSFATKKKERKKKRNGKVYVDFQPGILFFISLNNYNKKTEAKKKKIR